jgi:hypothetical protein
MLLPTIIFGLFALASAAGAYFLFAHQRGRGMGLAAAMVVLALFAALFWVIFHLVMSAGIAGPASPSP